MVYGSGMYAKKVSLDARHLVLTSIVAKELLNGQKVVVVRCEEIGLLGQKTRYPSSQAGGRWKIDFALNTGGIPDGSNQDNLNSNGPGLGRTRLSRILSAGARELLGKLNSARKNFPMKIFLLLLGFYTANALATILGQTDDWAFEEGPHSDFSGPTSGSTACVAILRNNLLVVANAGDSRYVISRKGQL